MLIDKDRIVGHLKKLRCNGQIQEAIVVGAFSSAAVSASQELIVIVPGLDKVEPLSSEPVGVVDLELFIRALGSLSGDKGDIGIVFENNRIRAEQRHGGKMSFAVASPTTIGTRISAETQVQAVAFIEKGVEVALDQTTVNGVLETAKLLKAEEIQINVRVAGGNIFVGAEVSHNATFEVAKLVPVVGTPDYTLHINAAILLAVFEQITDYTQAKLILTGPDSMVAVREGGYIYIISPKSVAR